MQEPGFDPSRHGKLELLLQGIRNLMGAGEPAPPALSLVPPVTGASYGAFAASLVRSRARIGQYFKGQLFADPAFDILLGTFAAEEHGRRVAITDCALIARVPGTTGLRWVDVLVNEGLLQRNPDERDARRVWVRLTDRARADVESYLREICSIPLR